MKECAKRLNIVVPMAGAGSRFAKAGYKDPKPLIPVCGKPMIERVVQNLQPSGEHRFIFVCQKSHVLCYDLNTRLQQIAPGCVVIAIDGLTEGAACTVLEAVTWIDNDNPLMIANSDQYVDVSIDQYLATLRERHLDGLIMTMMASDPKWSFVGMSGPENHVSRVVEKQVISNQATTGIYNFSRGADFVSAARQMIDKGEKTQGEFYVAPVYNALIARSGYKVGTFQIGGERDGMYGLGTPDDLDYFLQTDIAKQLVWDSESCVV